ncbi:MAG: 16S rRNA (guanine(527)-N(7))-methyltransferase RsmG [Rikenellaceae bacterium]|jgi:16S rRNA (guanine527-N7)-methyltransferase|nr:16S rRNA (guanine(527)-N(7))-methyltransferase RsmG [Rikenellaceae bacterium]
METILTYFPALTERQKEQFRLMGDLYRDWNAKINVVSRQDIDQLYLRHVLHSLAIAKIVEFVPGTQILDVGTGGGFPGIPLAVLFPEARFTLIDSIGKKITVVRDVAEKLGLSNVTALHGRAEALRQPVDFVVSRAVADMRLFLPWVWDKITPQGHNTLPNGILCLKGGDLHAEMDATHKAYALYPIADLFTDPFFETKFVVYLPR